MTEPRSPEADGLSRGLGEAEEIAERTRTFVVGPYTTRIQAAHQLARREGGIVNERPADARLGEAAGLARAIDLDIVGTMQLELRKLRPATYLGSGKVDEIAGLIAAEQVALVVMDCALSPVQQRNLEKAWGCKVIDRTGLILEIFGRRARTREGALQVELAHLAYQKSRLVRSWTHLERQRGGFGFLGGPGETQIEADRRVIQERMTRIERDLKTVKQTRALHRASRRRVPYPIIALIGYTNAGKSTIFNRLTAADVLAEDLLFATLDPTARAIRLPHGATAILSDTVGFISDLPTTLVAAFRATLEDVIEADVLLHVRDISHVESAAEAADVEEVLRQLGIDPTDRSRLIEVWNKADLLDEGELQRLAAIAARAAPDERPSLISATTGEGADALLQAIEERVSRDRPVFRVTVPAADGQALHWLYEEAEVIERDTADSGDVCVVARVAADKMERLRRRFPTAEQLA